MKKIVLSFILFGLLPLQALFADSVWRDIQSSTLSTFSTTPTTPITTLSANTALNKQPSQSQQTASPKQLKQFRKFSLDESQLKYNLQQHAISQNLNALSKSSSSAEQTMEIPLPTGELIRVSLEKTQLLSPKLTVKYPFVQTWKVRGVDDKRIRGAIDVNSYGFHAMLLMPDGDTVFVERENRYAEGVYKSFSKQANSDSFKQDFQCDLHGENHKSHDANALRSPIGSLQRASAREAAVPSIIYRLIVGATGEYTQYHGNARNALSAIQTTINRVNVINERDLSITFHLEDVLIYSDPARDPYTNSNSRRLLLENINIMRNNFSASEFDIGHVFSQGSPSGLALLGSVCQDDNYFSGGERIRGAKAGGVTGSPDPRGDAFDVDFVAHELGHQLGGLHTFNSETGSCTGGNRTGGSAVEPGSGSTIMAYAGICGSNNNLQNFDSGSSDDYYHTKSIGEIFGYTRVDNVGKSCGSRSNVSNSNPEPDAKQDTVIPARTPFILKGTAVDPDGDSLTYAWDQMDTGEASDVGVDTGDNALIRSLPPTSLSTRYVPRLKDVFQNRFIKGEQLPTTNRDLNFSFIVRDGEGGVEFDDVKLQVSDTGQAFALTSHDVRRNLEVNQQTTVSWNVAGTNASPINCSAVDISLIQVTNGKHVVLRSNTSNDGSETIIIPSSAQGMNAARMMVACHRSSSTFFNIAKGDITIAGSRQEDTDGDGIRDFTDTDDDNDGVSDAVDAFPLNETEFVDTDGDGIGNNTDTDDDNDGVPDATDAFPLDNRRTVKSNDDGTQNSSSGSSSGGGSLNSLHLLFLLFLVVVSWKIRNKKAQKIKVLKRANRVKS